MSSANPSGVPYEVHASAVIARILRNIQERATGEGRGELVLGAIRQIYQRLRTNPTDFGEPLYRLPALRMIVHCAMVLPLVIDFGICEDRPLVFIKDIRLLEQQE